MLEVKPSVELLAITPNALELIECCGRTCYKSGDLITAGSASEFVKRIIKLGHESVLEHAVATFRIVCDRGVSHELVRHRLISVSQESTRYCNYSKDKFGSSISVIKPAGLVDEASYAIWKEVNEAAEQAYLKLLELGNKPDTVRSVLPTDLKTELCVTANFREWRYIVNLRAGPRAHYQMRQIASAVQTILEQHYPEIFAWE